jgi:hypothetical protein
MKNHHFAVSLTLTILNTVHQVTCQEVIFSKEYIQDPEGEFLVIDDIALMKIVKKKIGNAVDEAYDFLYKNAFELS